MFQLYSPFHPHFFMLFSNQTHLKYITNLEKYYEIIFYQIVKIRANSEHKQLQQASIVLLILVSLSCINRDRDDSGGL